MIDRGADNIELEHDAWRGIEVLLRQTRHDVDRLYTELRKRTTP
jgi:hypothetical protein